MLILKVPMVINNETWHTISNPPGSFGEKSAVTQWDTQTQSINTQPPYESQPCALPK
jgi:hypothetical protein